MPDTRQPPSVTVRRLKADDWSLYRSVRLRSLADSPDAFGSTWALEHAQPDLHWIDRLRLGATSDLDAPLIAEVSGSPAGLVWGRIDPATPSVAHIYQMWVAPESRGAGVGTALMTAVIAWAQDAKAEIAELRVTSGDSPARRLYERCGFRAVGESTPLRQGSVLTAQPMQLSLRKGV